jgi:hypothetical protein
MSYIQKAPSFDAIQWNGSNQTAVLAWLSTRETEELTASTWTDEENENSLIVRGTSYFNLFAPLNNYIVHGPRWGSYVQQAGYQMRTPAEFADQFEEVV